MRAATRYELSSQPDRVDLLEKVTEGRNQSLKLKVTEKNEI